MKAAVVATSSLVSSTGNTAEVNHTQMGLNQLMTHYLMALQERSVVQDESKLYLEHLRVQHRDTKRFIRQVRDEMTETKRYLKTVYDGFSLSKIHGGLAFSKKAILQAGGSSRDVKEDREVEKQGGSGSKRKTNTSGNKNGTASGTPSGSTLYLIQQISSLKDKEEQSRNAADQKKKKKKKKSSTAPNLPSTRVALAKSGELKATFQTKTLQELMAMNVIAGFDYKQVLQSIHQEHKTNAAVLDAQHLGISYLIAGEESNHDLFTISGTIINQHMVEHFVLSLQHMLHLKRTMIMTHRPPNSNTLFNVSDLVDFLSSMHQKERVLTFGS